MSITDELLEEASGYAMYANTSAYAERLRAIANHIDAAHESAMYNMRREHDEWVADRDANWVKLPVDADGEVIHIGDVMEWPDHTDDPFEVIGIGNGTLYYVEGGVIQWTRAETKRHYAPDTWEHIIEDALSAKWSSRGERSADFDALVARCKALAGDGE